MDFEFGSVGRASGVIYGCGISRRTKPAMMINNIEDGGVAISNIFRAVLFPSKPKEKQAAPLRLKEVS